MKNRLSLIFAPVFVSSLTFSNLSLASGWDPFNSKKVDRLATQNSELLQTNKTLTQRVLDAEEKLIAQEAEIQKRLAQIDDESQERLAQIDEESQEILKSARIDANRIRQIAVEESRIKKHEETVKLESELEELNRSICSKKAKQHKLQESHDLLCKRIFGDFNDFRFNDRVEFRLRGFPKTYYLFRGELEKREFKNTPLYIMLLGKNQFEPSGDDFGIVLDGIRFPAMFEYIYSYIANDRLVPGITQVDKDTLMITAKLADYLGLNILNKKLMALAKGLVWSENYKTVKGENFKLEFISFEQGMFDVPVNEFNTESVNIDRDFWISKNLISVHEYKKITGQPDDDKVDKNFQPGCTIAEATTFVQNLNELNLISSGTFRLATMEELKVARSLAYSEDSPLMGALNHLTKPIFSTYEFDINGYIYQKSEYTKIFSKSKYNAEIKGENDTGFRIVFEPDS